MPRFEVALHATGLLFFALLAAWRFAQTMDLVHVMLAIVFGLLIPAGVAWEWWVAKFTRDEARLSAILRMIPFVTMALTGIILIGH